jgi:mRNA interferase MazF
MRRGEVWWVEFDERRPVVLLSGEGSSGFLVMQVVAPADTDISGLGIEVGVGVREGLPFDGVLRFVFPRPGLTPCTWLTTLSKEDLIERAGTVPPAKLSDIDDALRASQQTAQWTPAATARLSEIKDSLAARPALGGRRQFPGTARHPRLSNLRPIDLLHCQAGRPGVHYNPNGPATKPQQSSAGARPRAAPPSPPADQLTPLAGAPPDHPRAGGAP